MLDSLGINAHARLAGAVIILVFEVTIIGFATAQAFVESYFGIKPVITVIVIWIIWTYWHSWLFPKRRLRYIANYRSPYRRAFVIDIYPWVSIGFSQMWRPLFNGNTLDAVRNSTFKLSLLPVVVGLTLCFIALGIIIQAIRTIGIHNAAFLREFIEPDTFEPIRSGIYARAMHPLFWSGILYSCGLAISLLTTQALLIGGVNVLYGVLYTRLENRRLARIFGARYDEYHVQVRGIIGQPRGRFTAWFH